jgi:hypothetical protein
MQLVSFGALGAFVVATAATRLVDLSSSIDCGAALRFFLLYNTSHEVCRSGFVL